VDTELRFDRDGLRTKLRRIAPRSRAVFAALCARRLIPAHAQAGGSILEVERNAFAKLHARLWSSLAADPLSARELEDASAQALALLPAEEDYEPLAEDAVAALVYALRTAAGGEPQDAAWSAERIYDALDKFLQDQGYDPGAPGGEDSLRRHSLVQAEFKRQAADLRALSELEGHGMTDGKLERLRERADADAVHIFG
jgi:hypothetical protein